MSLVTNSVRQLRKEQLKTSKREFKARGSLLVRCPECLLGVDDCVCGLIKPHQSDIAVCMLMYHAEYYKPSNTGQLICDAVLDNFAFRWYRTELEESLEKLLADPTWYPIIVFPHDSVSDDRKISEIPAKPDRGGKRPLLIFLDGTWRQAKKMFIKSPYLDNFPVLEVSGISKGEYKLRESQHEHHLSTVEVAAAIFNQAGETDMANDLMTLFTTFRNRYQLLKR
ncbi:MAG: DTW domain-containing protein [Gammaproteobacteria bacterium]|nr:DTW domain-containing protein [Gammaproteobacteria bacterium]